MTLILHLLGNLLVLLDTGLQSINLALDTSIYIKQNNTFRTNQPQTMNPSVFTILFWWSYNFYSAVHSYPPKVIFHPKVRGSCLQAIKALSSVVYCPCQSLRAQWIDV